MNQPSEFVTACKKYVWSQLGAAAGITGSGIPANLNEVTEVIATQVEKPEGVDMSFKEIDRETLMMIVNCLCGSLPNKQPLVRMKCTNKRGEEVPFPVEALKNPLSRVLRTTYVSWVKV